MSEFDDQIKRMRGKRESRRGKNRDARLLEVERLASARGKKRLEMRELMPEIAGVVDEFRAVFGDDQVRVLYAQEGGQVVKAKGFVPW